jgi:signal transduction histidine kinase
VLAFSAVLASRFTHELTRSLAGASAAAMSLARREPVVLQPTRVRELNELGAGLRDAASALGSSLRERDEAERLKDEFLMTLSHELRTPLTVIAGWARMLVTGQIPDDQRRRAAEVIDRNAGALTQLVDDLLDVSRSIAGKLRLELRWIDFGDVVRRSVDAAAPAAAAK